MIFGEDFGQLASCGEYEVYRSGTTIAQLNAAITSLSDEEYLDSRLVVNTDALAADEICVPGRADYRSYYVISTAGSSNLSIIEYWSSNVLYYSTKTITSGSMTINTKSTSGSGSTLLTINSWKLYRRQKGYDVASSGGNAASLIAPIQTSLSAAKKAYTVGEQFVYDNKLYKVTSAITSGAQIVIGTNAVAADDITTQIMRTDWTDCKASGISGIVYCKRVGDIVSLHISISAGITTTYTLVGTLPADMIPSTTKYLMGIASGATNEVSTIQIQGGTGKISIANSSSGTKCFAEPIFMI